MHAHAVVINTINVALTRVVRKMAHAWDEDRLVLEGVNIRSVVDRIGGYPIGCHSLCTEHGPEAEKLEEVVAESRAPRAGPCGC